METLVFLQIFVSRDFVRNFNSSFLKFSDDAAVVLGEVDGGGAEDGRSDSALVVVVVGLATEAEVKALERGHLKMKQIVLSQI